MRTLTIDTADTKLKEALCVLNEDKKNNRIYKGLVSNLLAEYIVSNIDDKHIKHIIRNSVYGNDGAFRNYIEDNIKNYINRKLRIYDVILEYIRKYDYMNFEGFIRFRLREYYKKLEEIIVEISREYENEIKYRNFICIIKDYISTQTCIVENLNIYKNKAGKYLIFDDYYNDITEICEKEFINEFGIYNLNANSLVLNSILTLAPRSVTFHRCSRYSDCDIIKAVSDVYGNEMQCCENCILCQNGN